MSIAHASQPDAALAGAPAADTLAAIGEALLGWYVVHRRDLPWRRSRDAYRIWVSEIMLQQTQVATVVAFYERWMARFPDVASLATADTDDVLRAWEGLGYYSRARNLLRAAREVVERHGGQVPRTVEELRRLPGIGRYSAGAIASIAFDAAEPAVDGNIVRVLTRLFCLAGDPKRAPLAEYLWQLARALIPAGRSRDFNQALMELGATCCTPRSPTCGRCPLAAHCGAFARAEIERFPAASRRPTVVSEARAVALVWRKERVLVAKLPPMAPRWAGLWLFPDAPLAAEAADAGHVLAAELARNTGLEVDVVGAVTTLRHQITRFRFTLMVMHCRARAGRAKALGYADLRWCTPAELPELAMPAPHRKIARGLRDGS